VWARQYGSSVRPMLMLPDAKRAFVLLVCSVHLCERFTVVQVSIRELSGSEPLHLRQRFGASYPSDAEGPYVSTCFQIWRPQPLLRLRKISTVLEETTKCPRQQHQSQMTTISF
jgi:hypothetical protein